MRSSSEGGPPSAWAAGWLGLVAYAWFWVFAGETAVESALLRRFVAAAALLGLALAGARWGWTSALGRVRDREAEAAVLAQYLTLAGLFGLAAFRLCLGDAFRVPGFWMLLLAYAAPVSVSWIAVVRRDRSA